MIWGVGTGHCGTHSLAQWLELKHEPRRQALTAHMEYYFEPLPPQMREDVLGVLREGGDMVDSHLSPLIPLILEADPDARFAWVWRNYANVLRSHDFPALRWYWTQESEREPHEQYVWRYWYLCNTGIYRYLSAIPRDRWFIIEAEDLPVRHGGPGRPPLEEHELTDRGLHIENFLRGLRYEQREEDGLPVLW